MKLCCHCKEVKPLTEFHKRKGSPDGYQYICKACKKKEYGNPVVVKVVKPKPVKPKRKFTEGAKFALGYYHNCVI